MSTHTDLGKIKRVWIGNWDGRFGVWIDLGHDGWGVCDSRYWWWGVSTKVTEHTKWTELSRNEARAQAMLHLETLCDAAKVDDVAKLVGKPVEVIFEGTALKGWRLLTEVI